MHRVGTFEGYDESELQGRISVKRVVNAGLVVGKDILVQDYCTDKEGKNSERRYLISTTGVRRLRVKVRA